MENNELENRKETGALLIKRVRPMGGATIDVFVRDGHIQQMEPDIVVAPGAADIYDGHNQLLLPGFVDAHAHADKNLLGLPWQKNQVPGSRIRDYVENERRVWRELDLSSRTQSAQQVRAAIAAGVTHIRSHVDIDPETGPGHFEGMLATRAEYKNFLTMQLVAFPQGGLLTRPGALELMEAAIQQGADCVGGLDPSTVERDPVRHLDTIFGLADRYGVEVDIHLHEPGALGAFSVELIAERTRVLGLQGRVTISHVFCLGMIDDAYLGRLTELLIENQITIMSLGSGSSPFPPLKFLYEAGVSLCTGSDGVQDAWGPYNSVDMLNRVKMLGYRSGLPKDEDIEMLLGIATHGGAKVMGDHNYGLQMGKQADFVIVPGDTPAQAVIDLPPRTYVVKRGRLVAAGGECLITV